MAEFLLVVAAGAISLFIVQGIGVRFLFGSNSQVVSSIDELKNYSPPRWVVGFRLVFHVKKSSKRRLIFATSFFLFALFSGWLGVGNNLLATMGLQLVLMGYFGQGAEIFLFNNVTDFIATPIGIISLGDIVIIIGIVLGLMGIVSTLL